MSALADRSCVVLGGGGFIGVNLCRALAGRVRRLRAFGRRQTFAEALAGVEWFNGDFADSASLALAVEGFDTVVHLVNTTTPASANVDKVADVQANVVSTLKLLEICRVQGVRRLVFVSSGGTIYGVPERIPTPETAATWPITAYGISKLTIEKYIALYRRLHGLECCILRVANPFGEFQTAAKNQGVIAAFLAQAMAGRTLEIWGDGSVVRDYLYIDDLVDALMLAMNHTGSEFVYNIGSGQGRSIAQVIEAIEVALGRRIQVHYNPRRNIDAPASILDITRAREQLGWAPKTDFSQGLARTAAWMSAYVASTRS